MSDVLPDRRPLPG